MNEITLKQIEIFIAVTESSSFSEAARNLFVDTSVISRWIQRLEMNLGTRLFERSNKGVTLTSDGEILYDDLKPLYSKLSQCISKIKKHTSHKYVFRIGCLEAKDIITTFNKYVFQFRKLYPNVLLEVELYPFDELRKKFINEEIDFAMSYYVGFGEYENTQYQILKKQASFFVVSKDSPAIIDGDLRTSLLADSTLYLVAPAEVVTAQNYMIDICKETGFVPKNVKYMPNLLAIELAIKKNQGFTIGPDIYLQDFPKEFRLYPIKGYKLINNIAIFWHSKSDASLNNRFIETLIY